jgi:GNAT superfamily N-acetyltransferase
VRRSLGKGLELDDDPARIDVAAVHDFLANQSYWAEGRPYDVGRQVGFARAFTDGVSLVYLADVYVLPEYRGRGLGVELVREMVERGPYADIRWVLHTRDAHRLYGKFRFDRPSERLMERYHQG